MKSGAASEKATPRIQPVTCGPTGQGWNQLPLPHLMSGSVEDSSATRSA